MERRTVLAMLTAGGLGLTATRAWSKSDRSGRRHPAVRPAALPHGYVAMGRRFDVPPLILYGVALQESALPVGSVSLPWPWTLNVQRVPRRYGNYAACVEAMRGCLAVGIRNVDAGLMQVNWGYHREKLIEPAHALDPYRNIAVGAQILREHFTATGDWYRAIGRYHSPGNAERAGRYAAAVLRRMAQIPPASPGASSELASGLRGGSSLQGPSRSRTPKERR